MGVDRGGGGVGVMDREEVEEGVESKGGEGEVRGLVPTVAVPNPPPPLLGVGVKVLKGMVGVAVPLPVPPPPPPPPPVTVKVGEEEVEGLDVKEDPAPPPPALPVEERVRVSVGEEDAVVLPPPPPTPTLVGVGVELPPPGVGVQVPPVPVAVREGTRGVGLEGEEGTGDVLPLLVSQAVWVAVRVALGSLVYVEAALRVGMPPVAVGVKVGTPEGTVEGVKVKEGICDPELITVVEKVIKAECVGVTVDTQDTEKVPEVEGEVEVDGDPLNDTVCLGEELDVLLGELRTVGLGLEVPVTPTVPVLLGLGVEEEHKLTYPEGLVVGVVIGETLPVEEWEGDRDIRGDPEVVVDTLGDPDTVVVADADRVTVLQHVINESSNRRSRFMGAGNLGYGGHGGPARNPAFDTAFI